MRRSKNLPKLEKAPIGDVFWNGVLVKPSGEVRREDKDTEFDTTSDIQTLFTNRKPITETLIIMIN